MAGSILFSDFFVFLTSVFKKWRYGDEMYKDMFVDVMIYSAELVYESHLAFNM